MSAAGPVGVGLVGAGRMGLGLARNLLRHGHAVRVCDPALAARERAAALGATITESAGAAAAGAEMVVTCLPDVAAVRVAYLAPGGILEAAAPGCLCLEMTSSDCLLTREIGAAAAARGVALVDAPMLRGAPEAWAGTVHVLLGGVPADKARARVLLAAVAERVIDAGALGDGHALKALNNAVTMGTNAVLAEAMMAGGRLGFTPALLTEVLASGLGAGRLLELYTPRFLSGDHPPTAALSIGEKDLAIFLRAAGAAGAATPVRAAAHRLYRAVCAAGRGDEPPSRLADFIGTAPDGQNEDNTPCSP